jgi:uncharacterized protein (TIGR01244 family)
MSKRKLFLITFLLTAGVLLGVIYVNRPAPLPKMVRINDNLYITSQLKPESIVDLRIPPIRTIVDLRPDGEAKNQPSSAEIELAAKRNFLAFHYIPVPHGAIPNDAVRKLGEVLSHEEAKPALLYCRTGNRAVRTFALAEASRAGGPGCDEIIRMVHDAGFSADDLKENITQRISQRSATQTVRQ